MLGLVTYPEVAQDPGRMLPDLEVLVDAPTPRRLAIVRPEEEVPDPVGEPLRFHPWNTGPELQPAGLVNRLRRPAYAASQVGRDAA